MIGLGLRATPRTCCSFAATRLFQRTSALFPSRAAVVADGTRLWTLTVTARGSAHSARDEHSTAPVPSLSPPPQPAKSRVERLLSKVRPYADLARVDKPIGTLLLFYPCAWSITMASYAVDAPLTTPLFYTVLFGIGALVMRGAGCTINDLWDRDLDKAVARTQKRPIARGDVSVKQAIVFLAAQLTVGLGVLLQLNTYSILLGASSLALVTLYPLMKRVTYWPQLVLGLTFNWGALLGWSAVAAPVDWSVCLPLYASGVCWTLVYDTIYAHQDKVDDVRAGIRSTALLFGRRTRPVLLLLSCSAVGLALCAGSMNGHGLGFTAGAGLGGAQLARVLFRTRFDVRPSCWQGFVACGWFGFWVWMGALADYILVKM